MRIYTPYHAVEDIRLSDILHTEYMRFFWHPIPVYVGCENIHTIPCNRRHQTFWHPTRRICEIFLTFYTCVCRVWEYTHYAPCSRRHRTFWHPTRRINESLLTSYSYVCMMWEYARHAVEDIRLSDILHTPVQMIDDGNVENVQHRSFFVWVMPNVWMSLVKRMNESCHI